MRIQQVSGVFLIYFSLILCNSFVHSLELEFEDDTYDGFIQYIRNGQFEEIKEMFKNQSINAMDRNGITPLIVAMEKFSYEPINEDVVKFIIKLGADVNQVNPVDGSSPLHVVSSHKIAELLIRNGAFVNAKDFTGRTPMITGTIGHESLVMNVLFKNGADLDIVDNTGKNALDYAAKDGNGGSWTMSFILDFAPKLDRLSELVKTKLLPTAIQIIQEDVAVLLIQNGANVSYPLLKERRTLHLAARYGKRSITKSALAHGADVNVKDEHGLTPLHWAVKAGAWNVLHLLISNGADVLIRDNYGELASGKNRDDSKLKSFLQSLESKITSKNQRNALILAIKEDNLDIVDKVLRNGANLNHVDSDHQIALHTAVELGKVEIVELLIKHGASLNQTDSNKQSALHLACKNGHKSIVEILIKNKINLDLLDTKATSALTLAFQGDFIDIAHLLISNGADGTDTINRRWFKALKSAAEYVNGSVVEWLIKNAEEIDEPDYDNGDTALIWAAKNDLEKIICLLISNGASAKRKNNRGDTALHWIAIGGTDTAADLLIKSGANIDHEDVNGCTALHYTAQNGNLQVANVLLGHGANVNVEDEYGQTALFYAAEEDDRELVDLLLSKEADINTLNIFGYTPLHSAVNASKVAKVEWLLKRAANPNNLDIDAKSTLYLAIEKGNKPIVDMLIENGADVNLML